MSAVISLARSHRVYAMQDVDRVQERTRVEEPLRYFEKMRERGEERYLVSPSSASGMDSVLQICPNFGEVVADVKRNITLTLRSKGGLRLAPILLLGDPGVGKTHFAKALAKALGTVHEFVSMNALSAGFVLTGSSSTWKGAKPGRVAMSLIEGMYANPVIVVDELDKASGDRQSDPMAAILQLLEPETSSHFHDEYLDLDVDCSRVLWVMTANDERAIPDPVLSRLSVYEIRRPDIAQSAQVAQTIYAGILSDMQLEFDAQLRQDVLAKLTEQAPREMRKALVDALGMAAEAGRDHLVAADLKGREVPKRAIGFH
jgi:ATP-dependent Lon protease